MLPERAESERQIRDVSPAIFMALFAACVVTAASTSAMLAIDIYREYRAAQVFDQLKNPPVFLPFPEADK